MKRYSNKQLEELKEPNIGKGRITYSEEGKVKIEFTLGEVVGLFEEVARLTERVEVLEAIEGK